MTKLSVNINKLATLRNARGGHNPDLTTWSNKIQELGAAGITVHPRPDERHIRRSDIPEIKQTITTEFNIEGYPSPDFIALIKEFRPDQCTLVPDPPEAITSNAGWDTKTQLKELTYALTELKDITRVSVFVEPDKTTLESAKTLKNLGVHRAEIYTEEFAHNHTDQNILNKYRKCADQLLKAGLDLNAGHDLDQKNLGALITLIPEIKEVSIGHALVCEALEDGMAKTVKAYLDILS